MTNCRELYNGFFCDESLPKRNRKYRNISHDCIALDDNDIQIEAVYDFSRKTWFSIPAMRKIGVVVGWKYCNQCGKQLK